MIPAVVAHLWQSTLFAGAAWLIALALANESSAGALLGLVRSIRKIPDSILFAGWARDSRPPSRGCSGNPNRMDDRGPGI